MNSGRPFLTTMLAAACALPLGGCFLPALVPGLFGGGGKNAPPAPTVLAPPTPAGAARSLGVPDKTPAPSALSRSAASLPFTPATGREATLGPQWEFRSHYYRPVSDRGESELGRLVVDLGRQGWELHNVQINLSGPNFATFRRLKRQPVPLPGGLPGLQARPAAAPAADAASAPPPPAPPSPLAPRAPANP